MLVNEFITLLLNKLELTVPRVRDACLKLHIQIELQNDFAFNLINYFIMLQPEYKYHWELIESNIVNTNFLEISKLGEFLDLQMYFVSNNLLEPYEAIWLEDAIHEVLVDYIPKEDNDEELMDNY